ncbi:MAG: hypothetical protein ABEJ65_05825 [bacterium]
MNKNYLLVFAAVVLILGGSYLASYPYHPFHTPEYFSKADAGLNTWILHHELESLRTLEFRQLFRGNFFHPLEAPVLLSEHFLSIIALMLPVYLIVPDPYFVHNLAIFISYPLCALGMYLLARELNLSPACSLVSALVFTFSQYRLDMNHYVQLSTMQWMPFTFLYLHKFVRRRSPVWLWLAMGFFMLQALSSAYYLVFFAITVVLFFLFQHRKSPDLYRELLNPGCLAPMLLSGTITCVAYLPYVLYHHQLGIERGLYAQFYYGADLLFFLSAPDTLLLGPLTGWLGRTEGYLYPGGIALLLTVYLVWKLRKQTAPSRWCKSLIVTTGILLVLSGFAWVDRLRISRVITNLIPLTAQFETSDLLSLINIGLFSPAVLCLGLAVLCSRWSKAFLRDSRLLTYGGIAVVSFLISLGPVVKVANFHVSLNPVALQLHYLFPGFAGLRAISRAAGLIPFGLAITAGLGLQHLTERFTISRKTLIFCVVLPLLVLELFPSPKSAKSETFQPDPGPVYSWLERNVRKGPILEWPVHQPWSGEHQYVQYSMIHKLSLVNGYSGFQWKGHRQITRKLNTLQSPQAQSMLDALGVRYLLVHQRTNQYPPWADNRIGSYVNVKNFERTRVYVNRNNVTNYVPENYETLFESNIEDIQDRRELRIKYNVERNYVSTEMKSITATITTDKRSEEFQLFIKPQIWNETLHVKKTLPMEFPSHSKPRIELSTP